MFILMPPERTSREHLEQLAKGRLEELRRSDRKAKLSAALMDVASGHGFSSWHALNAEIELRQAERASAFFEACALGDVEALRGLLAEDPGLVGISKPDSLAPRWTGLHSAARHGHVKCVQLLVGRGADPNAREAEYNTSPLHWAAALGHVESVRALLDAGADVHGAGDADDLNVIGWATFYSEPGKASGDGSGVAPLLLERGAEHHIFSAIAVGDLNIIKEIVEAHPMALRRRLSRLHRKQTPLHFAAGRGRYDVVALLLDLGAEVEAEDGIGRTALADATYRADRRAIALLRDAGAQLRQSGQVTGFLSDMAKIEGSVRHATPMMRVPDIDRTFEWYKSIGFKEVGRDEKGGRMNWGLLTLGKAELMLLADGEAGPQDVMVWFYTNEIDRVYELFKLREWEVAQEELAGRAVEHLQVNFVEPLSTPFYGGRQFSIRDPNGYVLYFRQPADWFDGAKEFEGRFTHQRFRE